MICFLERFSFDPMPNVVTVERHEVLSRASFALMEARIRWCDGRTSTGWGRDAKEETATAKAICEAVERYCYTGLPTSAFTAKAEQLEGFIAPDALVRYDASQYRTAGFSFQRFCIGEQRLWLPTFRVTGNQGPLVLADMICNPRAFEPDYRRRLVTHATTSGCASAYGL